MFKNDRDSIKLRCKICKRIFCCAECCNKHEIATHAFAVRQTIPSANSVAMMSGTQIESSQQLVATKTVYIFCPICEQKPLVLYEEIYDELMLHIQQQHLPLSCKKCNKMYTEINDFKEFSKCVNKPKLCTQTEICLCEDNSCETDTSKLTLKKAIVAHSTMSTQTSPPMTASDASVSSDCQQNSHKTFNVSEQLTPISIINLRWQAKSKIMHEEFISDSVSSIKNLSTISNSSLRRSVNQLPSSKVKLIRSTSTPLQVDTVFTKPKEPTFNATGGGHVSSIYNSGYDSEHSPALVGAVGQNPAPIVDTSNVQRYQRKVTGGRAKLSAVTTPLRQVMSKSIQKAFVEHGGMLRNNTNLQRRNMLQLIDSSVGETASTINAEGAPLDLRLSPAMRRTQSEGDNNNLYGQRYSCSKRSSQREFLVSAEQVTTESIVITRTKHQLATSVATKTANNKPNSYNSTSSSDQAINGNDDGSSTASSTTNSVYQTCESVEIVTATAELSIQKHGAASHLVPATPITRAPGSTAIQKKLIKFETPQKEPMQPKILEHKSPEEDAFYTPSPVTPVRKLTAHEAGSNKNKSPKTPVSQLSGDNSQNAVESRKQKKIVPRQLSRRFSPPPQPQARRPLREFLQNNAFSRVEDVTLDTGDYDVDDEIFIPEQESTKHEIKKPMKFLQQQQQGAGRIWSLMSSVMRLPKFKSSASKSEDSSEYITDIKSNSIIKRCASIAGSLVRSKPMLDDAQVQSLKRKRTNTLDNQTNYRSRDDALSPPPLSSKRLRIHGRKPIERMRINS